MLDTESYLLGTGAEIDARIEALSNEHDDLMYRLSRINEEITVLRGVREAIGEPVLTNQPNTNGHGNPETIADAAAKVTAPLKRTRKTAKRAAVSDRFKTTVIGVLSTTDKGELTAREIADQMKSSQTAVMNALRYLLDERKVRKVGATAGPHPAKLWAVVNG